MPFHHGITKSSFPSWRGTHSGSLMLMALGLHTQWATITQKLLLTVWRRRLVERLSNIIAKC